MALCFFTECCCKNELTRLYFDASTPVEMLSLIELLSENNQKTTMFTSLMRSVCFNVVTSLFSNFCCYFVIRFFFHLNFLA